MDTAKPSENPGTTGRTVGDILDSVLERPKRWFAFIFLFASILLLALGCAWIVARTFGLEASEATFGPDNAHVVFQRVQKQKGISEYVVSVSPQGWQNTFVDVNEGDKVTFHAGGKICIDMNDILSKVALRLKYEDEIANAKQIRRDDPSETRVPEDYFTEDQRRSLILHRPWVGPNGFDLRAFEPTFRSRRNRYLLPGKPAGGLVAAITPGAGELRASEAFFVGSEYSYIAAHSGQLWFTVNDVQFNDPNNENLFYNDNLGSFFARVQIEKKEK